MLTRTLIALYGAEWYKVLVQKNRQKIMSHNGTLVGSGSYNFGRNLATRGTNGMNAQHSTVDTITQKRTLSPARIRKESMTCSAVSVSVDSLVMKSKKASKVT